MQGNTAISDPIRFEGFRELDASEEIELGRRIVDAEAAPSRRCPAGVRGGHPVARPIGSLQDPRGVRGEPRRGGADRPGVPPPRIRPCASWPGRPCGLERGRRSAVAPRHVPAAHRVPRGPQAVQPHDGSADLDSGGLRRPAAGGQALRPRARPAVQHLRAVVGPGTDHPGHRSERSGGGCPGRRSSSCATCARPQRDHEQGGGDWSIAVWPRRRGSIASGPSSCCPAVRRSPSTSRWTRAPGRRPGGRPVRRCSHRPAGRRHRAPGDPPRPGRHRRPRRAAAVRGDVEVRPRRPPAQEPRRGGRLMSRSASGSASSRRRP